MVSRNGFSMIELIFAIVVISIGVLSLPMMSEVTSNASASTMKTEEAVFEAYVKALEVTDAGYDDLNGTGGYVNVASLASDKSQGLKLGTQMKATVQRGVAFLQGGAADNNIALVTVEVKDADGLIARLYTYDFNVSR